MLGHISVQSTHHEGVLLDAYQRSGLRQRFAGEKSGNAIVLSRPFAGVGNKLVGIGTGAAAQNHRTAPGTTRP